MPGTSIIVLKIVVAGIEAVRAQFDRLKVYRCTTGATGVYTEVTTPTTRIVLQDSQLVYEFQDNAGSVGYFYRVSYYNSLTTLESSLSDPQQGEGDSALSILSVDELKSNYLLGVDLTIDDGTPYPNSMFEFYIKSAVSYAEHRLDMPLRPTRYVDETHDYFSRDYDSYLFLHLKHYPIINVEQVKLVFPGNGQPTNPTIFKGDDLLIESESGQVNIVPTSGASGAFLGEPWQGRAWARQDFIPQVFRVTYTAGFEAGQVPAIIKDYVGRFAAFGPLHIAGDLLGGAGVASQSISIDGLSQSIATTSSPSFAGYGARLLNYAKDIKNMEPLLMKYYKGLRLTVA